MKRSHVTLIISSLAGGGAERVLVELADYLASQGKEVTILTLEGSREDRYHFPLSVHRVRLNIMWESRSVIASFTGTIQRIRMIRKAVREISPDLVISFIDTTNVRVLLALAFTDTPIVVAERTDPRHHPIGRVWDFLRRVSYRLLAARLVVQTQSVAEWAYRWLPKERVEIVPNAVRPFDLMKAINRPSEMPIRNVIIGVGRLSCEKGFDRLILAFASSGLAKLGWSLVILGEGSARSELTSLVIASGLMGHVLLPGMKMAPDEWLRSADIFVLSSRYEGFPNVLIEAMQCGVASVAFDCESGPAEIIQNGLDGLLVPPDDINSLSDAMRQLAEEDALRKRLGSNAKAVLHRFSPENTYGKWQSVCEAVIAEKYGKSYTNRSL